MHYRCDETININIFGLGHRAVPLFDATTIVAGGRVHVSCSSAARTKKADAVSTDVEHIFDHSMVYALRKSTAFGRRASLCGMARRCSEGVVT